MCGECFAENQVNTMMFSGHKYRTSGKKDEEKFSLNCF